MDELELIRLAREGDETAFSALVETHLKRVYNIALRIVRIPEDAEDVAQEVFIRLYRSIRRFNGDSSLSTFLYRITVNCASDLLRKRGRRKEQDIDEIAFAEVAADSGDTPEEAALKREKTAALRGAVDSLAPSYREVFVLREYAQLSYSEIAETLLLSEGTVKSRLNRARSCIRETLLCGTLFEEYKSNNMKKGGADS